MPRNRSEQGVPEGRAESLLDSGLVTIEGIRITETPDGTQTERFTGADLRFNPTGRIPPRLYTEDWARQSAQWTSASTVRDNVGTSLRIETVFRAFEELRQRLSAETDQERRPLDFQQPGHGVGEDLAPYQRRALEAQREHYASLQRARPPGTSYFTGPDFWRQSYGASSARQPIRYETVSAREGLQNPYDRLTGVGDNVRVYVIKGGVIFDPHYDSPLAVWGRVRAAMVDNLPQEARLAIPLDPDASFMSKLISAANAGPYRYNAVFLSNSVRIDAYITLACEDRITHTPIQYDMFATELRAAHDALDALDHPPRPRQALSEWLDNCDPKYLSENEWAQDS